MAAGQRGRDEVSQSTNDSVVAVVVLEMNKNISAPFNHGDVFMCVYVHRCVFLCICDYMSVSVPEKKPDATKNNVNLSLLVFC